MKKTFDLQEAKTFNDLYEYQARTVEGEHAIASAIRLGDKLKHKVADILLSATPETLAKIQELLNADEDVQEKIRMIEDTKPIEFE